MINSLQDIAVPVAISLTIAAGGMTVSNSRDVAVLQTETTSMLEIQREMNKDVKNISRLVYHIDAKLGGLPHE